jgi:chromosome segregation ATPase
VIAGEVHLREELERQNHELKVQNEGLQGSWLALREELEKVRQKRQEAEEKQSLLSRVQVELEANLTQMSQASKQFWQESMGKR